MSREFLKKITFFIKFLGPGGTSVFGKAAGSCVANALKKQKIGPELPVFQNC